MKIIAHFFLMLMISMPAIAQTKAKLVSEGNRWNEYEFNSGDYTYKVHYYEVTGDTIINERTYIKVYRDSLYAAAIREHADSVFIIYGFKGATIEEKLLYDFNWKVGDSVCWDSYYGEHICFLEIEKIDSILLEDGNYYACINDAFGQLFFIKDIGEIYRVIYRMMPRPTSISTTLICFWSDDQLIYFNRYFENCEGIHTGSVNKKEHQLKTIIKTTPDNTVLMFFENLPALDCRITVYDIQGKPVRNSIIKKQNMFDAGMFNTGFYFFRLVNNNGDLLDFGKFIITR
ncbi:MAG: T9SS type A sorting domain-containing protein [Bacteroidales bacterium]|nr:T9SS type A sorting domain-containing protein [Bacteroidales bacterium]